MTIFATLLLAHLLSDFPLQTNRIFHMKLQGHKGLALHTAIHVLVTALLIRSFWQFWPVLLLLGMLHYLTDWAKLRYTHESLAPGFIIDQGIHLITLAFIASLMASITPVFPLWFLLPANLLASVPALLTFGYVLATDKCRAQAQHNSTSYNSHTIRWACNRLLPISQKTGWVVVITLVAVGLLIVV